MRDRLAALDGLHESGHLSDDEHRVARQMAISGQAGGGADVASPAPPPGGKADATPLPPVAPAGTTPRKRLVPALLGALGVAIIVLIIVLALTLGGGDSSGDAGASASGDTRTARVTQSLTDLYVGSTAGRCFGPRSGASFTVNGSRQTTDFLNCGDDDPARATGTYEFMELPEGTIKTFTGLFAIDEGSANAQRASTAQFTVRYGDTTICSATVTWGSPYRCRRTNLNIPTTSGTLVIEQDVSPATSSSASGLWAGIVGGRIGVSEVQPAP